MGKRLTLTICCASVALFAAGKAIAADLPPEPAPPPEVVPAPIKDPGSCIYGRLDGGYAFHSRPKVTKNGGYAASDEDLDDGYLVDAGVGCYFNDYVRADLTVGYRTSKDLGAKWNAVDAEVSSYTGMVNAYFDIGHFGGVTPYVGAGIGVAHNRVHDIKQPGNQSSGNSTRFAWALHAGASVQVTENIALDASYRYIDLGSVKADGPDPIKVDDLRAHDVRIGLRISLND